MSLMDHTRDGQSNDHGGIEQSKNETDNYNQIDLPGTVLTFYVVSELFDNRCNYLFTCVNTVVVRLPVAQWC